LVRNANYVDESKRPEFIEIFKRAYETVAEEEN
jgi:hypothetical protein